MLAGPPVFTLQPISQSLPSGATLTLTVAVEGFQPIVLQWRKDGQALPGETQATLVVADILPSGGGAYDCVATNQAGETTSDSAEVTVEGEPVLPIYLGNAGQVAQPAYSAAQIKALQQTGPQFNPVLRSEFTGIYEISAPASGLNEYRVIATPAHFVDGTIDFRSGGAVLPMTVVQTDLTIDGVVYRVYRTSSRSAGDFTQAGNTAILVVVH